MKNQSINKMLNLLERIDKDYKMLVENEWHEPAEYETEGNDQEWLGHLNKGFDKLRKNFNKTSGLHGNDRYALKKTDARHNDEDEAWALADLNGNTGSVSELPEFSDLKQFQKDLAWDAKETADSINQSELEGGDGDWENILATNWNVEDEDGANALIDYDRADAERHMNENRFKRFIKETVKSVLKESYGSEAEEENNAAYARQRQAFEKAVQILQQLGIRANGDFRESPKIYTDLCWREDKSAFDKALRAENILKKSLGKYGDWVKTDNEMSGFISFTI